MTFDFAVYKRKIFRVPPDILADYRAISDDCVFNVPEGILAIQHAVRNFYIATAVKTIVSVDFYVFRNDFFAVHPEIIAVHAHSFEFCVLAGPKRFARVFKIDVGKINALATAEILGRFHVAVLHF